MKTPLTVLVIEDDPWFAEQHMRTLEHAGFRVRQASDAVAGMAAIDEDLPDAVVLDMFLPGPNALVLLHEMQSYSDLAQLPIIVCSNSTFNLTPDTRAAYGVAAVLDKGTMKPQDLVAAVRRVLL
jgi:DNA-binding response OmpR family regulator